jgi:hypothetical protein
MPITEVAIHTERATNGQGVTIPRSAYTLAGFRAWAKSDAFPERGRMNYWRYSVQVKK